ncbi:protein FLX-like 3 isoform X1 [Lactuca sativa]|uniref:protein FLX-like 3 isoform X1 n=1 Tax=Lactuca sativa TaxID=4236 RepID=UPI001C68F936|nr:protein FLX-like 3 isoform X1 [Lactuca sativa]
MNSEMEGRNYIAPSPLKLRQNLKPLIDSTPTVRYVIGDHSAAVQHPQIQSLLIDNQHLLTLHEILTVEFSASKNDLRHLSAAAEKIKAERDAEVREAYDRAVTMEAEVRSIDESNAELAKVLGHLQKLRSEKKELDEKLYKLRGDVEKVSLEYHQIPLIKAEIESMQKEIQRGREVIEHEKRVHVSNIKQREAMEKCRMFMAREIERLQVEVNDAVKRARAAAAVEAASILGSGYGNSEMG